MRSAHWVPACLAVAGTAHASDRPVDHGVYKRQETQEAQDAAPVTNIICQTIISDASGAVTLPTGLSTTTEITLPAGSVITVTPTTTDPAGPTTNPVDGTTNPTFITTTDSLSQTIIYDSSTTVTIPTGISSSTEITLLDGSVTTLVPTSLPADATYVTTTDSLSQTIISGPSTTVTIPTEVSSSTEIILPDGSTTTLTPTSLPPDATYVTTTDSLSQTIVYDSSTTVTIPTGVTTTLIVTLPDGSETTLDPSPTTTTTTPVVVTLPDGSVTTSEPPASEPTDEPEDESTDEPEDEPTPVDGIRPVTTQVDEPKATDDGTVIPCNLWFFDLCLQWDDIDIGGWVFNLPEGIRPPGPPPPITFPPELGITIGVSGTLPPWPALTIGPDKLPTFEPKPTDQPDEQCETESAELCFTRTSYGVDTATITTASDVVSTCATVYGCNVEDSSTETTTTSACSADATECATCIGWSYDEGVDWESEGGGDPDGTVAAPAARRVKRGPIETATTLVKRVVRIDTRGPQPTTPPIDYTELVKRVVPDGRSSTAFGACNLRQSMTLLDYLEGSDFPNYPRAASFYPISRKSTDTGADGNPTCVAGYMYSTDNIAGVTAASGGPTYLTSGSAPFPTPVLNVDHVYENALLGAFFTWALEQPDAPSCEEFNTNFVDTGLLQTVFDNLANVNNPDFALVDRFINRAKANFFPRDGNAPAAPNVQRAIDQLQTYGIAAAFLNFPEIIALFRSTHQRLFQIFGAWDQGFQGCNIPGVTDDWAPKYSSWMTDHLSSRAGVWTSAASNWYNVLSGAANPPPFTHLSATYPVASFSMPVSAMAADLAALPRKRQDGGSCTLDNPDATTAPSDTPSDTPSETTLDTSGFPTLTGTNTEISTPPGQTCVSTVIESQCALGPGQAGSACVSSAVCATFAPTSTTTTNPPAETTSPPEPDWESDACQACSTNMGAIDCAGQSDFDVCTTEACKVDDDCAACGADCETAFRDEDTEDDSEDDDTEEAPAADWSSDVCKTCQDRVGLEGDCGLIGEDDQCITDLCKSIDECSQCNANCDEDFKPGGAGIPEGSPPNPSDPSCDVCLDDMNSSGCDDLFEFDPDGCYTDVCLSSEACQTCGGSCDVIMEYRRR